MNDQPLAGVQWHGFATLQLLLDSLAQKRANRRWVDGNDGIAVHLNPEHFITAGYDDRMFNEDMGWRLLPLAVYQQMKIDAGAMDNLWANYQCQNFKYGPNPLKLERRYGVMKAHGHGIQDTEAVFLEQHEVTGDLRCRRRLVFPEEVAAAIGAEPLVLLQYKRWPFCHPPQHRLELLLVVEAIEAAEEGAAIAVEGGLEEDAVGGHDGAGAAPAGGEAAEDGAAPAGGEAAEDGAAPAGGEAADDGAAPAGGEAAEDAAAPAPAAGEAAEDGAAPAGGEAAEDAAAPASGEAEP